MAAVAATSGGDFEVCYRTAVGADPIRVSACEAAEVEFELAAPFRPVRPRRGERNFVGDWWLATTKRHVTFESWCERDHLIAFDFDPEFVGISGQPFQFQFTTASGSRRTHIPDYFLRTAQDGAVVVDIKPDDLIGADDRVNFAGTAALCGEVGWAYQRLGELAPVLSANLRWLAGYRHERVCNASIARRARKAVEHCPGVSLGDLANDVGEPMLVLPTIFHMLWNHHLAVDLFEHPLSLTSRVYPGSPT